MLNRRTGLLLLLPATFIFALLIVAPITYLARASLLPPAPGAPLQGPFSLASYGELRDPYLLAILLRTLRVSGLVTAFSLVLGFPLALSIVRARGTWRTAQLVMVVSPLFVSVVVRAYGWMLLLGNRGVVNGLLMAVGLIERPIRILNTEGAVVVGLVEALLPFMVLSLVAVLERLDPGMDEAARGLGAGPLSAFWYVTLPLALPGVVAGSAVVFMVSMGSFATPTLLGGAEVRLMVTEIYAQATAVFNWPLAAALSMALLAISVALVYVGSRLTGVDRVSGAV